MTADIEHEHSYRQERDRLREAHIQAYYQAGYSLRETGKKFGVSTERIRQILGRIGVQSRQKRGPSKDTEKLERVKWCLYLCGVVEIKTLCELFDVPLTYIYTNKDSGTVSL